MPSPIPNLPYHPPSSSSKQPYSSTTKYPNFHRSHVMNPSVPSLKNQSACTSFNTPKPLAIARAAPEIYPTIPPFPSSSLTTSSYIDPILPPLVKLTKQFSESCEDSRFVMSRLRDPRTYANVRLYLAFLHDKPHHTCIDGKTRVNLELLISKEGLPIVLLTLKKIFIQYHECFNISPLQVANDLSAYAAYLNSKFRPHVSQNQFFRH